MGYTHAIDSLKGVLITLGTSIGEVMLVYGGIKFAMAFRQMDQQGKHQAVYSVVAGGHEIGRSMLQFLKTFFGFCISGAMMVVIIKTGCTLCTDLVRGTDSIIARML